MERSKRERHQWCRVVGVKPWSRMARGFHMAVRDLIDCVVFLLSRGINRYGRRFAEPFFDPFSRVARMAEWRLRR